MRVPAIRLKTVVAVAITLSSGGYAQTPSASSASARLLVEKARGSIAVVTGENRAGRPVAPGLGFLIGANLIATHNYVIVPAFRLHTSLAAGQESSPVNISYSDSYRLATIMTASSSYLRADPLSLGDSDKVAVKDRVYLFGDPSPQGEILEAVVTGFATVNSQRFFELSTPFKESMRGAPVFNEKGEVIALLSQSPEPSILSLAVPASNLTTLLKARNPVAKSDVGSGSGSGAKITTGPGYGAGRPPSTGPGLPSTGPGYGTGLGGGTGTGGPPSSGPGQPSTGSGSGPAEAVSPPSPPVTTTRPKAINTVRPQYSEIARGNQTQGVVLMRILVGADGDVKRAVVTKGLPDDLNERAVEAAFELKFQPATRNGVAVDYTIAIQVEFTLR